ncbi:hypothetical protein VIGAN_01167700 [Vigna angularis var. angularis]|uniref:Uncharacterized protein n=1 Tax=Vigna angularis var. angularis TaxID=157739 RepID=A0A0S3R0K3_PHAAN|nr:hypothetical protein VIGAN_01167700 [Vigna angularis var. angularis]
MMLFGFLENVSKCKKTIEKMFRMLDLYNAICENQQQSSPSSLPNQPPSSYYRNLQRFQCLEVESSKIPVPGGGIHPVTRYVMNYIDCKSSGNIVASIATLAPNLAYLELGHNSLSGNNIILSTISTFRIFIFFSL